VYFYHRSQDCDLTEVTHVEMFICGYLAWQWMNCVYDGAEGPQEIYRITKAEYDEFGPAQRRDLWEERQSELYNDEDIAVYEFDRESVTVRRY